MIFIVDSKKISVIEVECYMFLIVLWLYVRLNFYLKLFGNK